MHEILKNDMKEHVAICRKILSRHLMELNTFYENDIKPVEYLFRKDLDQDLDELVEYLHDLYDNGDKPEYDRF